MAAGVKPTYCRQFLRSRRAALERGLTSSGPASGTLVAVSRAAILGAKDLVEGLRVGLLVFSWSLECHGEGFFGVPHEEAFRVLGGLRIVEQDVGGFFVEQGPAVGLEVLDDVLGCLHR